MHPEDIKAAIRKRGSTQTSLAKELRVSLMAVGHVVSGNGKSARIARRISEVTGISVHSLWPGKYPQLEREQALARAARPAPRAQMNQTRSAG